MRTHYIVAGEGPPLVLLHGLGASVVAWRDNIAPLAERFTVYAVDIPGHGDSEHPNIRYTLEEAVSFTAGFLDGVGAPSAALVGNSMGGLIALRTALAFPARVSHLVLVDTAGFGREVSVFVRLASLPLLGRVIESGSVRGTRAVLRQVLADPTLVTPELVEEFARVRSMPGAKDAVLKVLRHGVGVAGVRRKHRLLDRLRDLTMPLLTVWGEDDHIFPVAHAYAAARYAPDARLEVFSGCGHWPMMERADAFNALLTDFLTA